MKQSDTKIMILSIRILSAAFSIVIFSLCIQNTSIASKNTTAKNTHVYNLEDTKEINSKNTAVKNTHVYNLEDTKEFIYTTFDSLLGATSYKNVFIILENTLAYEECAKISLGSNAVSATQDELNEYYKLYPRYASLDLLEIIKTNKKQFKGSIEVLSVTPINKKMKNILRATVAIKKGNDEKSAISIVTIIVKKGNFFMLDISMSGVSLLKKHRAVFNKVVSQGSVSALVRYIRNEINRLEV